MYIKKALSIIAILLSITSCIKKEALNAEADILSCTVPTNILIREPVIQNNSITIRIKDGTEVSAIAPTFTLTPGATIEPASGTVRDFTTPQKYTVTSQNKEWSKTYTVTFTTEQIPTIYTFQDTIVTPESKGQYFVMVEKTDGYMIWASGNPGYKSSGMAKNPYDYPTVQDSIGGIDGGKCAKLQTKSTGAFGSMVNMPIAAGNLFIGSFDGSTAVIKPLASTKFGLPFYHEPTYITGFYKYKAGEKYMDKKVEVPGKKDMFSIYAVFYETTEEIRTLDGYFKANGYTSPNLVALGMIENPSETDEWKLFTIPFKYDYNKTIDNNRLKGGGYNVSIIFTSSVDGDNFAGAVGSTLYLDKVELHYKN